MSRYRGSDGLWLKDLRARGGLAIASQEAMPVGFRESIRRQRPGYLFQRAAQAHEIRVAPQAGGAQRSAIEIDEIHGISIAQKNVVRIQIRVADAQVMKLADGATHGDPVQNR